MSGIEIRDDYKYQGPDEIVIDDASSIHFEYMSNGHVWCGIGLRDGRYVHVNLFTKRGAKGLTRCEVDAA